MEGRAPPHSIEAEQHLIACCLLDGEKADSLNRCLSANLTEAHFYSPANRIIFSRMVAMMGEGKPIDLAVLSNEIKSAGQLEAIGGYAYLTHVTSHVPTTAHAEYFIAKLLELYSLREAIKIATGLVEGAFSYNGQGVAELLAEPTSRLMELSTSGAIIREPSWPKVIDEAETVLEGLIKHQGLPPGDIIPFPWESMNRTFQPMQRGQLVVIGARSSVGKSSFARQIACHAAMNSKAVYFDTLEVRPVQVALQMAAMASRIGLRQIPQAHAREQEDFKAKLKSLKAAGITMSSRDKTLAQFVCRIKALKSVNKVDLAVLDYGGLLHDVSGASQDDMVSAIGRVTKSLKGIAMELGIVVALLWQLNRSSVNDGNRVPRQSDLRSSGACEEDSDKVILIHRPTTNEYSGELQDGPSAEEMPTYFQTIIQAKGRDDGVATMEFEFHRPTTSFRPWTRPPEATNPHE